MSHLPAARYILEPSARVVATSVFLTLQTQHRARDHKQWVLGMDRKAKARIRRNKLAHISRRRQWGT